MRRLHMRTVDESHDDIVSAGFNLNGDLREAIHDFSPAIGAVSLKLHIFGSTDRSAGHNLAVDHDNQRALILQLGRVVSDAEVIDREAILAIGGEVVFEPYAATSTQRQGHVGV